MKVIKQTNKKGSQAEIPDLTQHQSLNTFSFVSSRSDSQMQICKVLKFPLEKLAEVER